MIQKPSHHSNIDHPPRQDSDAGIEQWGQWWGRKSVNYVPSRPLPFLAFNDYQALFP
jgi:hypothetical protein